MTKILFFTDPHFRNKSPINRTDDILETALEKMKWILEYAKENKCVLICGGDFWQTPSQPDFVASRVASLFEEYHIDTYFIIGNHDCVGGNTDSYEDNKLGLFQHYSWFKFLHKLELEDVIICGNNFSREEECPEIIDTLDYKSNEFENEKRVLIAVVHCMITDDRSVFVDGKYLSFFWGSVNTTADIVLCGHYHPGIGIKQNKMGSYFVNPGAMVRLEASKIDINRIPQVALIEINKKDIHIKLLDIPHKKDVFNLEVLNNVISSDDEKRKFIEALDSLRDENLMSGNIISILDKLSEKNLPKELKNIVSERVIKRCREKILLLNEEV